jgi:hypothetical protein
MGKGGLGGVPSLCPDLAAILDPLEIAVDFVGMLLLCVQIIDVFLTIQDQSR